MIFGYGIVSICLMRVRGMEEDFEDITRGCERGKTATVTAVKGGGGR